MKQTRKRLDEILVDRGWAKDRNGAFIIVTEGRVFVNGQKAVSPAQLVGLNDKVEIRGGREFVGRGAYKLEGALEQFRISVEGAICADVGSATGGFVEVLLNHGAKKVYAIDAGRGKLDLKLREDPRVVVMEGVNVLALSHLPLVIQLVTIDVSFTSLRLVLPIVRSWLAPGRSVVALFKPQYEIEDTALLKKGIVRNEDARTATVEAFRRWLNEHGWHEKGAMASPIRGSTGNVEYLFWLSPNEP